MLYGLGARSAPTRGTELPAAYLHLSRYLKPGADLTLMALGDLLFGAERCEDALQVYDLIPAASTLEAELPTSSPALLRPRSSGPTKPATRLNALIAPTPRTSTRSPPSATSIAAASGSPGGGGLFQGIATIGEPTVSHWRIYYFRGVANERSKNWTQAEADLKVALELSPDQAAGAQLSRLVWVTWDHPDEGLDMIRWAVDQRPNDGYIVDSLGWAYRPRLGRYHGGRGAARARRSCGPKTR